MERLLSKNLKNGFDPVRMGSNGMKITLLEKVACEPNRHSLKDNLFGRVLVSSSKNQRRRIAALLVC